MLTFGEVNVLEIDFKKKRAQLRLNLFLAMILLLGAAVFSSIYGVVFFVNEWKLSVALADSSLLVIGVGSCAGAFALIS